MDSGGPRALVLAAASGDQAAWDALVDRFGALVWSITRSFRLDGADAADVSQVTWLRLVENLDRLQDPDRVGSWLATTARRECLRALRRHGRSTPADEALFDSMPAQEVDPIEKLVTADRDEALWRALRAISSRCQQLLRVLMADPAPTYEEVSAGLDMPVGSIGPTRARCLEQLRRSAAQAGITGDLNGSGG